MVKGRVHMGSLFDSLLGRNSARTAKSTKRFRPGVEQLEVRDVPALIASQYLGAFGGAIPVRPFPTVTSVQQAVGGISGAQNPPVGVGGVGGTQTSTVDVDCLNLFLKLGTNVTSGAARAHGQGQLKYWVCHHTGSAKNPFVSINVPGTAPFGPPPPHGDVVFIRRVAGGPVTTVQLRPDGPLLINGPDAGPFTARHGSPFT